jgi:hypothetical protein
LDTLTPCSDDDVHKAREREREFRDQRSPNRLPKRALSEVDEDGGGGEIS